jgi:hypothetical protein
MGFRGSGFKSRRWRAEAAEALRETARECLRAGLADAVSRVEVEVHFSFAVG